MTATHPSFTDQHPWWIRLFITACFIAALGIRVYDLNDPPLDFHPTRQLQSMIKARGMYVNSGGLPELTDWQQRFAIEQWKAMPTEEPEVIERLALWSYQLAGGEYLWIPRLLSILFWLIGGLALYSLASEMTGRGGGIIALLFYLFLPYGVIASRAFMPDPMMVMAVMVGLWAANRWISQPNWAWAVASGLLCGAAVYIKVTAVFIIAGGMAGLVLSEWGFRKAVRSLQVWMVAALCLLPALIYNILGIYVLGFIESGAVALRLQPNMLLQPVTYLMMNNMLNQVMGTLVVLLGLAGGFLLTNRRSRGLAIGLWCSYAVFGMVFIYFFATHSYYHLPLIPLVALGLAPLAQTILDKMESIWPKRWLPAAAAILLFLALGEASLQVRNTLKKASYASEPAFWQQLGAQLSNYRIIALSEDYNARLAYYGWTGSDYWFASGDFTRREIAGNEIDVQQYFDRQTAGHDVFLITLLDELDKQPLLEKILVGHYPILIQGDRFIAFDLRNRK